MNSLSFNNTSWAGCSPRRIFDCTADTPQGGDPKGGLGRGWITDQLWASSSHLPGQGTAESQAACLGANHICCLPSNSTQYWARWQKINRALLKTCSRNNVGMTPMQGEITGDICEALTLSPPTARLLQQSSMTTEHPAGNSDVVPAAFTQQTLPSQRHSE